MKICHVHDFNHVFKNHINFKLDCKNLLRNILGDFHFSETPVTLTKVKVIKTGKEGESSNDCKHAKHLLKLKESLKNPMFKLLSSQGMYNFLP